MPLSERRRTARRKRALAYWGVAFGLYLSLWFGASLAPPYWLHALIFVPLTIALAVLFLQPTKGAIIGWQWAQRMHGFTNDTDHDAKAHLTVPKR